MIKINPVFLSLTLGTVSLGCADDEVFKKDPEPICSNPQKPCPDNGSGSADEVGDGDGDPGDGDGYACTTEDGNGVRTTYQCNGHLTASISFKTLLGGCAETLGSESWCTESHSFGVGHEPYDMPAVMACCDPKGVSEDDLRLYCAADLVEQVCLSISTRIKALIEQADSDLIKVQAANLLWWFNINTQKCFDAFHKQDVPGKIGPVSWKLNGGDNKNWPALKDFTITVSEAVVESASLPADESDYRECVDDSGNNGEIFEERGPVAPARDVDVYHLGDSFNVAILGPDLPGGGRVHGEVKTTSQSICAAPWCSALELGNDSGRVVIDDLRLYADGLTVVTAGEMPIEVDGLTLRLYGRLLPHPYFDNGGGSSYAIDRGAAHFLVSGFIGGAPGVRWVSNTSPITAHESDGGWTLGALTLGYVDSLGTWEAAIPATVWN